MSQLKQQSQCEHLLWWRPPERWTELLLPTMTEDVITKQVPCMSLVHTEMHTRFLAEVRKHYTTTPRPTDVTTCAVLHANRKHARAGALVFSSSCLDESITRVGPGQYQTRAWLAREAVGSSQTEHHSTPRPTLHVSPKYIPREMKVSHSEND